MSANDEPSDMAAPTPVEAPMVDEVSLLAQVLYADMIRLARRERRYGARPSDTLGTTALVHEAYLKLARQSSFQSRAHFLNTAALAMRQVLVSHARSRMRLKNGAGEVPLDITDVEILAETDEQVVALDDALVALEQQSPRLARLVECRYFAGYSDSETAMALGISERTVQRDWTMAKAMLYGVLDPDV
ncbi:MAG: ECF-type sigma factor [Dokdonella sp.]|uniref:ECF-type sigma factor n=1 Tax=Dokdonella sp. TaxID=2291710 RepID=UPI0032650ACC